MTEDERQTWQELRRHMLGMAAAIERLLANARVADGKVLEYNLEDDQREVHVNVAGIRQVAE